MFAGREGIILNQKIFVVNEIFLRDKMTELFSLSELSKSRRLGESDSEFLAGSLAVYLY